MTALPKDRQGEHTPGPWRLHTNFSDTVSAGPFGEKSAIARCEPNGRAEANARRIVACVNYCEGVPTELLEKRPGDVKTVSELAIRNGNEADLLRASLAEAETLRPRLLKDFGYVPEYVLEFCNKARALVASHD